MTAAQSQMAPKDEPTDKSNGKEEYEEAPQKQMGTSPATQDDNRENELKPKLNIDRSMVELIQEDDAAASRGKGENKMATQASEEEQDKRGWVSSAKNYICHLPGRIIKGFHQKSEPIADGELTVQQIIDKKINESDMRAKPAVVVVFLVMVVIFLWVLKSSISSVEAIGSNKWAAVVFALVAVVSGMSEIRVKRIDEVIDKYKESYPKMAAAMKNDPWVKNNRSWATFYKYISIVSVFMAAMLAIF